MTRIPITQWAQKIIEKMVKEPGFCIDATAGTGQDTIFLCELCKKKGQVLAMDIQKQAIDLTRERVEKQGYSSMVTLIQDSHSNMDQYAKEESADLIMFNLGYLPGGDHQLITRPEVTLQAIEKGLCILKEGGMMSILIYSGGDSGFEEKNQILSYLKKLDPRKYTVIVDSFYNKPNNPPIPVFIIK